VTAETFGRLTGVYLGIKAEEVELEFMNQTMTAEDLEKMDTDGDGEVTQQEFLRFMLVSMGKVTHDDMDRLKELFEQLDANHDGCLQLDDLILLAKQADAPTEVV